MKLLPIHITCTFLIWRLLATCTSMHFFKPEAVTCICMYSPGLFMFGSWQQSRKIKKILGGGGGGGGATRPICLLTSNSYCLQDGVCLTLISSWLIIGGGGTGPPGPLFPLLWLACHKGSLIPVLSSQG